MGNIEERDAVLVAQSQHDVEDHGAQRCIDRRHRLVGHNEPGPQHVRTSHHDALALAAAELVRVLLQDLVPAHADQLERVLDQPAGFLLGTRHGKVAHGHVEDVLDAEERIVDLIRVLEDGLHFLAVRQPPATIHLADILSFVEDMAFRQGRETEDGVRERSLAAAAFTSDGGDARR